MQSSRRRTERSRSRILFPTAALPLLLGVLALALTACGPGPGGPSQTRAGGGPGGEDALAGLWFQLDEGRFEQIRGPDGIQPRRPRPWTVQERVADMAEGPAHPFLAVNGHGVAALVPGPSGFPQFRPFYDPLLFRDRTFAQLLPREGSLLCHVYFNSLLNDTSVDSLKLRGISLLELFPEDGVYRYRTPPFQREQPHWECVGLARTGRSSAILAWKLSAPAETRFAYTRLDLLRGAEQSASQTEYREALAFGPLGPDLELPLRAVALEAAERLSRPETSLGLQFLVRGAPELTERRYQILPPEFGAAEHIALLTLPVQRQGERFSLLTPDGTLLWAQPGARSPRVRQLPRLPEGLVYTDLLHWQLLFVAAWEERAFTDVGAAGLFLFQDPDMSSPPLSGEF